MTLQIKESVQKRRKASNIDKFNRKTFNPEKSKNDWKYIGILRNKGFTRAIKFRIAYEEKFAGRPPNKFYGLRSTAYDYAMFVKGKAFLDAGAGHSPDSSIARMCGFNEVYAVDLFPAGGLLKKELGVIDIKADICEKIPVKMGSVDLIICQAVLPLMNEEDRKKFYVNAYKLLKKGGTLSVFFCDLAAGHKYHVPTELMECIKIGFHIDRRFTGGFMVVKI